MGGYTHEWLAALEKQLELSPEPARRAYADRIEAFLSSFRSETEYSREFVYFRITGFRPSSQPLETCRGQELRADLGRLLERISAAAPSEAARAPEPVQTLEDMRARFKVSARTLFRWRRAGLVARTYVFPDGRRRLGVRESALRQFLDSHGALVARSSRFSRLGDDERRSIIEEVEWLVQQQGLSLTAAAERVARRTGRARETVRQLLRQAAGATALPARRGPLGPREKRRVYEAFRSGQSVDALCERFGRSRASIYRVVNEGRARALLADTSVPGTFIPEEAFGSVGAEAAILRAGEAAGAEAQRQAVRRYNFLKSLLAARKAEIQPARYVPAGLLDEVEVLLAAARALRRQLLIASLPLVVEVARLHVGRLVKLPELVSEGCLSVLGAIDRFDYRREAQFARFVRLELMKAFARTVPPGNFRGPRPTDASGTRGRQQLAEAERAEALRAIAEHVRGASPADDEEQRAVLRERFGIELAPLAEALAGACKALGLGPQAAASAARAEGSGARASR